MIRLGFFLALVCAAGSAWTQQYRWVDEKGRVQYSDTAPPPTAKNVQKMGLKATPPAPAEVPFELARVQKDFPVTLYTSPICGEPCAKARAALNKRSVPFKEVQVWDEASNEQLKTLSDSNEVPVFTVGRTVQKGFEQSALDALLDSAGYPPAGSLPPGTQAAPKPPEGWVSPAEREPARAVGPEATEEPQKAGPYAPRWAPDAPQKPGPYAPRFAQ